MKIGPKIGMTAAIILVLGVVGCAPNPDTLREAIKGDWKCSPTGDGFMFAFESDDSGAAFGVYSGASYELKIDDKTWKVAEIPQSMAYQELDSSGTYTLDNGKLVFRIEKYGYADGSDSSHGYTPDQRSIGKDFTISDLPAKLSERGSPKIKDHNFSGPARFTPIAQGFRIQRTDASYLDCVKSTSK